MPIGKFSQLARSSAKLAWLAKADFSDLGQLSAKFDAHKADFGITANRNKKQLEEFVSALKAHMASSATNIYRFNYRNQGTGIGFIDPNTHQMVMLYSDGKFWSAYQLGRNQFYDIIDKGWLW